MLAPSMAFRWTGEAMAPLRPKTADAAFVVGEVYWLEEEKPRSESSHRHEFAWLKEAWLQLPEGIADDFPTPEHLRKRAMIVAGYYHETIIDAGTNAAALRVASYVRSRDGFAHVVVRGRLVVERVAKSQSRRAMKADEFQESKTKVLEIVAAMIGVTPGALAENAERAA